LRADGSTRLAKAVSDLEYQYCPYFSDWERAILLCGSREVGVILKNSEQLTQCFDSDGGSLEQNFGFVLGATNQSANEITGDYCDGSYLVEGICNSSGQYEGQRVFCPEGCLQGICLGNPYQKATLTMSGSTVNYSDAVRGTGGLMHIKFFKSNGCNALSRKITSSEGSYMPSFDWSFVVLQQFYSGKGYVDISNTLTN